MHPFMIEELGRAGYEDRLREAERYRRARVTRRRGAPVNRTPVPNRAAADDMRLPLNGATAGRLRFTSGARNVDLIADEAIDDLCRARFGGEPPLITAREGIIRVRYPRLLAWPSRRTPTALLLNPTVPWDVEVRGGAQQLTADLRRAQLSRLAVHGGSSGVTLELPRPRGAVCLSFAKGVHQLIIVRARGTAARVSVQGGARRADLDGQVFGAVGGPLHWQTPDYANATHRYDITVGRGASNIRLATAS